MFHIQRLSAWEILDSRGRPTVKVRCELAGGFEAAASVPSGASTGSAEALELRDGDPRRYRGLGCRKAVANVNATLHRALSGCAFNDQEEVDARLLQLDGTPNKSSLGANAMLAVSVAFARASAKQLERPLYQHFARGLAGMELTALPRPTINLFSGGKHAGAQAPLQDVLIVPVAAKSIDEVLAMTFEVFQCAAELTGRKYGMRLLRADEGGLAPPFANAPAMLKDAIEAIRLAGLEPGRDVALAVDVASTQFHSNGRYHLDGESLRSSEMIERLVGWVHEFPIVSLEDGLAEEDWEHWPALLQRLSGRCLVVGDDFLCTNPTRIQRAIQERAADTLLLKVNQIGTVTEALQSCRLARKAGWRVTVSARSGETEDDWLADLAVGWAGDQIKIGSITQSERLAKYNRLLQIEAESRLPLNAWPGP